MNFARTRDIPLARLDNLFSQVDAQAASLLLRSYWRIAHRAVESIFSSHLHTIHWSPQSDAEQESRRQSSTIHVKGMQKLGEIVDMIVDKKRYEVRSQNHSAPSLKDLCNGVAAQPVLLIRCFDQSFCVFCQVHLLDCQDNKKRLGSTSCTNMQLRMCRREYSLRLLETLLILQYRFMHVHCLNKTLNSRATFPPNLACLFLCLSSSHSLSTQHLHVQLVNNRDLPRQISIPDKSSHATWQQASDWQMPNGLFRGCL